MSLTSEYFALKLETLWINIRHPEDPPDNVGQLRDSLKTAHTDLLDICNQAAQYRAANFERNGMSVNGILPTHLPLDMHVARNIARYVREFEAALQRYDAMIQAL